MSLQDEKNFYDVTPHRIRVTGTKTDNNGRPQPDPTTARVYRGIVGDIQSASRTMQGVEVGEGLSVWVLATPVDETTGLPADNAVPVTINVNEKVEFLNADIQVRPVVNVQRYFAEDGSLNNMVVRMS